MTLVAIGEGSPAFRASPKGRRVFRRAWHDPQITQIAQILKAAGLSADYADKNLGKLS
jgi:signal recognition particle subunit SEC65